MRVVRDASDLESRLGLRAKPCPGNRSQALSFYGLAGHLANAVIVCGDPIQRRLDFCASRLALLFTGKETTILLS